MTCLQQNYWWQKISAQSWVYQTTTIRRVIGTCYITAKLSSFAAAKAADWCLTGDLLAKTIPFCKSAKLIPGNSATCDNLLCFRADCSLQFGAFILSLSGSCIKSTMALKKKNRALLKWAGENTVLIEAITAKLPKGEKLIEPFVRAWFSIFKYPLILNITPMILNPDLINLYKILQIKCRSIPSQTARVLFVLLRKINDEIPFTTPYAKKFNQKQWYYERALFFCT